MHLVVVVLPLATGSGIVQASTPWRGPINVRCDMPILINSGAPHFSVPSTSLCLLSQETRRDRTRRHVRLLYANKYIQQAGQPVLPTTCHLQTHHC